MPLQTSGQISISDIISEIPSLAGDVSLYTLSTANINSASSSRPDGVAPHAMSEFYGYDHNFNPYTLIPGTPIASATKTYWADLCYSPTMETYSIDTPKVMVGTTVLDQYGNALPATALPGYISFGDQYVAQVERSGAISLLNDCERMGGPGDGGIGISPAPGDDGGLDDPRGR